MREADSSNLSASPQVTGTTKSHGHTLQPPKDKQAMWTVLWAAWLLVALA
jgi:hypothetical protein